MYPTMLNRTMMIFNSMKTITWKITLAQKNLVNPNGLVVLRPYSAAVILVLVMLRGAHLVLQNQ
jgi:hypothetical protein